MALGLIPIALILIGAWVIVQRLTLAAATSADLELSGEGAANEETHRRAASFTGCGYRKLAVYHARLRDADFSIIVMAGPDGTSWAEVTDRLWEVASTFGSKLLRTATHSMLPPGSTLVQCIPSGAPETIVAEHQRALASLAGRGLQPDRHSDAVLLARFESETQTTRAALKRSIWRTAMGLAWRRPLRQHHGRPALVDDPRAEKRIDAWLAACYPSSA